MSNATKQVKARGQGPRQPAHQQKAGEPSTTRLTLREQEVFRLMCQGLPNKEISARLGIALPTVKVHKQEDLQQARREIPPKGGDLRAHS